MRATYVDFTCDILKKETVGTPVYTNRVAQQLGTAYQLDGMLTNRSWRSPSSAATMGRL